jgi:3-hydroxyisobutyrate dehydrogenase-like beta-hydroxyacid dehydrogenase
MVNQITIAGLVQGLAEGLHFAKPTMARCADDL